MSSLTFTEEPPKHWNEICLRHGDLFNTSKWQDVLSHGFGSRTIYGWDKVASTGLTITVFKGGLFRVGYLGFPVGGTLDSEEVAPDMIEAIRKAVFPETVHLVRIPVSAFAKKAEIPLPSAITLETAIDRLQEWEPEGLSRNLKKSIGKAVRSPLRIEYVSEPSHSGTIYQLYRNTVLRHKGNMRYTEGYFRALIELGKINGALRFFLAMRDDDVAGFLAVAHHHETAYDLHCCIDPRFNKYNPSDLLTCNSIAWAKGQGVKRYNLMASPLNRASLAKYKEKWGGITRQHKTYELALKPLHAGLFKATAALYQEVSKFVRFR